MYELSKKRPNQKSNSSKSQSLRNIHEFLIDLGYDCTNLPSHLIPEKTYRIPSIGKKKNNTSTAITLKSDGTYLYYDHVSQDRGMFNPELGNRTSLSELSKDRLRQIESKKQQDQHRKQNSYAAKKIEAKNIWEKAIPCTEHPYLQGNPKTAWIKPIGARTLPQVWTGSSILINPLIIARYDIDSGELVNLEFITGEVKRPVTGAQSTNSVSVIEGKLPTAFCEGYKTGLAFHHATGHRVVVCSNVTGLKNIFPKISKPNDFIIADNDNALDLNDDQTRKVIISDEMMNGRGTGHRAAISLNAKFYMPYRPGADFADLSKEEIQKIFNQPPISSLPIYEAENQLTLLDKKKSSSDHLEMVTKEKDPFQCACAAYTFAIRSIKSVPYKKSVWDIREAIERAAEGNIHPSTLDNIMMKVRKAGKNNQTQIQKDLSVSEKTLSNHNIQNIKRVDQIILRNNQIIPLNVSFTCVDDQNTVHVPHRATHHYRGVFIVQAPTGSGKTKKVGNSFRRWCYSKGQSFLTISHRRSLVREISNKLNTNHYEDEKNAVHSDLKTGSFEQWRSSKNALSICLPSINNPYFKDFIDKNDYVFIDEITQVLESFRTDDIFPNKNSKLVYDKLCEIVSTAQCIIVADAIVNDHVIEFLERCRPNEKFNYIQVAQVNEGKEAIIYESEAALFHHILNSVIINNHNVWITCDTASKVEELAKTFNQHGDHINCLAITGPTQGNTNQVNFVKNPEEESKKYNVVIASSVISSGLSIQHDHFNFVAGFFSGNTIKPTDAYQMIGRVRQCKEFRLALNQKQKIEIKAHRILHGKQQASVLEDGVAANITAFSRMRANLIEAQYKALSNFANGFIYILEQKCFTIKHKLTNSEGTDFIEDPNIRKIKDDTSNEYKNALKEACPINDSMAQKLKNRSYLDEIERLELKAWQIKKDLGYPCEHVLSDQDLSISPDQINRFSAVIGRYKPSNDKEKDITSRNYNKALSKMYSIIFEDINLTAGAIFYTQCAHEILERVFQHRFTLVALDAIPRYFGKENYKLNKKNSVKALKNILEHLGITAKRKRNSRKVVQMAIYLYRKNTSCVQLSELESESHCYEITQSSMELMQQYSDMKFNSENVMAGNEVHQTELDDATYDILKNTTKLGARSINLEEVNRHSRATTSIINKAANSSEIHYLDAQGF